MPLELRQTVAEIVYPVYEEMVLQATGMDRNLGASLVYLLWLEVLDQFDVKTAYCEDLRLGGTHDRTQAIDRHLKLVGAKLRIGNFMLRLREFRLKQSREQASSSPTPLAIEPSAPERLSRDNPLPPCPARPSATSESASLILTLGAVASVEKSRNVDQNGNREPSPKPETQKDR